MMALPTDEIFSGPGHAAVDIRGWADEAQLVAKQDFVEGALLVGEYPIAFAPTLPEDDSAGPWMLVDMILSHPGVLQRVLDTQLKLTRWPLDEENLEALEQLAARHKRKPKKIRQLYYQVAANNIRYKHGDILGFGIWPTLSRSNHSCAPNARLCAARNEPLAELLLATRAIRAGEQIAWNYFSDDAFLERDWLERNARLQHSFQFLCRCSRCEEEMPQAFADMSPKERAAAVREQWRALPA